MEKIKQVAFDKECGNRLAERKFNVNQQMGAR